MRDSIFDEEQQHLNNTYSILMKQISILREQVETPKSIEVDYLTNQDEIPYLIGERIKHYDTTMNIRDKLSGYIKVSEEVYFARIDIDYTKYSKTYYIGKYGLNFLGTTDWRSDIGALMYDNTSSKLEEKYNIDLKRRLTIRNSTLIDYKDITLRDSNNSGITDEFLINTLNNKKTDIRVTDIIQSIQRGQNIIIRLDFRDNLCVLGCAGSGKTMIMFHRLSYLNFHEKIRWNKVKIITPNDRFKDAFKNLSSDLGLSNVKMMTLTEYFVEKLRYLGFVKYKFNVLLSEYDIDSKVLIEIYSAKTQSAMFTMFSEDLNKITSLISILLSINMKECTSSVDQYKFMKSNKDKIVSDFDNNLRRINEKLIEVNMNVIENVRSVFDKILLLEKSYFYIIDALEIKENALLQQNNARLEDAIIAFKTLVIPFYDKSEIEIISNSKLNNVNLLILLTTLEDKINNYSRICSNIAIMDEKLLIIENQYIKLNEEIMLYESKINELKAERESLGFFHFIRKSEIISQIESHTDYCNSLISNKVTLENQINNLKRNLQSEKSTLTQFYKVNKFDEDKSHEYKTFLSILQILVNDCITIKKYNESLSIKRDLEEAIKQIELVTSLHRWYDEIFINKYVKDIMHLNDSNSNISRLAYHFYYYYLLLFAHTYKSSEMLYNNADQLICIDEFQDISKGEIELIREINFNKVVLNLYGDFNQRLLIKGSTDTRNFAKDFSTYKLNNNY